MRILIPAAALLAAAPAVAQTTDSITLYEYPAFFGRSVTVNAATPDLATQGFASKARSARVTGSWTVCRAANYADCRTLTSDQQTLFLVGLDKAIVSLRPTNPPATTTTPATGTTATTTTGATATGTAATTTAATVKVADLDVDAGTVGQDTEFYRRPSFGKIEVSAGANDKTAGDAFCKAAGYTSSAYAARARVQASGLIDLATSAKVRAYPLRDVLCRR